MKIKLLFVLFLPVFLFSCGNSGTKQTVKVDGKYLIELPASFKKVTDLNADASLQYQDISKKFYTIVIDEPKADYERILNESELYDAYSADLKGYSKLIIDRIDPSIAIDSLPDFEERTVNGMKSRQVAMEGVTHGNNIYWKFAFVEGKSNYYQVMVWTVADNRRKFDDEMQEIIDSFRETDRSKKQ